MIDFIAVALGGTLLGISAIGTLCMVRRHNRHQRRSNKRFIAAYKAGFRAASRTDRRPSAGGAR